MLWRFFIYPKGGRKMMAVWRMLLFAGLISIFSGILYVTSLLETVSDGMNIWGYFLLFWGIFLMVTALNQIAIPWIIKGLAVIGIFLNGSLALYWLLFPVAHKTNGNITLVYILSSIIVTLICLFILGTKVSKTPSESKSLSG
jgi:uncharacterized membrane protein HdeD (DUF308 family)